MKALSVTTLTAITLAVFLSACDGGPSAVASNPAATVNGRTVTAVSSQPVPMIDGHPMWAANRRHSAQDNAAFQFRRNGQDFGATTQQAYVAAAHAFVSHPPAGAQTMQRSNGDRLIYDPAANTFAVVTSDGAPRTLFKPRTGAAYWAQQQARAARQSASANAPGGSDSNEAG